MRIFSALGMSTMLVLAGCATSPEKYSWGNYENSLYSYYKDSGTSPAYASELKHTVLDAQANSKPVAPGLHAEYGFLLLQEGKSKEAIAQFEREKSKWPESTMLMNNMIRIASNAANKLTASKE